MAVIEGKSVRFYVFTDLCQGSRLMSIKVTGECLKLQESLEECMVHMVSYVIRPQ